MSDSNTTPFTSKRASIAVRLCLIFILTVSLIPAGVVADPLSQEDVYPPYLGIEFEGNKIDLQGAPIGNRNGFDERNFTRLWTYEPESDVGSSSTTWEAIRNSSDWTFDEAPTITGKWNRREITNAPTEAGDDTKMHYPDQVVSSGDIKQDDWLSGYVATGSITPSTIVHFDATTTDQYVGETAKIRGVRDWTFDHPELNTWFNDNGCSSSTEGDVRYKYKNPSSYVKSTSVAGDYGSSTPLTTTTPSTPKVKADNIPASASDLGIQSTIEGEIEKHKEECDSYTDSHTGSSTSCSDGTCSTYYYTYYHTHYRWEDRGFDPVYKTITPSHTEDVTSYSVPYTVEHYDLPNGEQAVKIIPSGKTPWQEINLPTVDTVRGNWEYYIARNRDYDTFKFQDINGNNNRYYGKYRPVQTHMYPESLGVDVISETPEEETNAEIVQQTGGTHSTPSLPSTANVGLVNGSQYNNTKSVTVTYPDPPTTTVSPSDYESCVDGATVSELQDRASVCGIPNTMESANDIDVGGVVRGDGVERDISSVASSSSHDINDARVRTKVTGYTGGNQTVEITAEEISPSGVASPLDTSTHSDAYIELAGKRVNTDSSGTTTVTIPRRPTQVELHSPTFHQNPDAAFAENTTFITSQTHTDGFWDAFAGLLHIGMTVSILLWFTDKLTGINIWPPWGESKWWDWS